MSVQAVHLKNLPFDTSFLYPAHLAIGTVFGSMINISLWHNHMPARFVNLAPGYSNNSPETSRQFEMTWLIEINFNYTKAIR